MRVGSDHSPIVLDSGEQGLSRPKYFYFENKWLLDPELMDLVIQKWQDSERRRPLDCYYVDAWHGSLAFLRQFLKGWGIQKAGEVKHLRSEILYQLEVIDSLADTVELPAQTWQKRYQLDNSLEYIYQVEESHWKQRCDLTWVLEGDSNTQIFSPIC